MTAIKVNDHVRVEVSDPDQNLGTWVSIEQVTLAEFGRSES